MPEPAAPAGRADSPLAKEIFSGIGSVFGMNGP